MQPAPGGQQGTAAAPFLPPPQLKKRRTGLVVGAVVGVLALLGAAAFGVIKLAAELTTSNTAAAPSTPAAASSEPASSAPEPSDVPTTMVKQATVPLAAGQTRVVDKADGLTFVLPKGWTQAPTSPRQLVTWMKKAQARNPSLKGVSTQQLNAVASHVAVFAVYTGAKSVQDQEYLMVMRSPVAMPPITADAVPAIQAGMAKTAGLQNVQCKLTTVAGAPAVLATMQTKVATNAGTVRLHVTAYVVNSPTVNGFFTYFYSRVTGDPRGDMATVMASFDPHYPG